MNRRQKKRDLEALLRSRRERMEKLRFLLNYGVLAPAQDGQLWTFALMGDVIELRAAHRCHQPTRSQAHRPLIIRCGAALFELRMALRELGFEADVMVTPDRESDTLLARVALTEGRHEAAPARSSVLLRAMDRAASDDTIEAVLDEPISVLLEDVEARTAARGVWIQTLSPGDETVAAAAIVQAWQFVRGAAGGECDAALALGEVFASLCPFEMRFDEQRGPVSNRRPMQLRDAVSAAMGTISDTPDDWLALGEALAHLHMAARAEGLVIVLQDHNLASPALRARMQDELERTGVPQVVMRIGYPKAEEVRPLLDVSTLRPRRSAV
jgi:hypothetical protein